jgi:hydroxymethylglutaryl-CoA reductase (NADPH)
VRVRRLYVEAVSAQDGVGDPAAVLSLPVEEVDGPEFYSSVLGTNCENVVGFVPLPVGVIRPLLLDGRRLTAPLAPTSSLPSG